jgi:hypothetical protein
MVRSAALPCAAGRCFASPGEPWSHGISRSNAQSGAIRVALFLPGSPSATLPPQVAITSPSLRLALVKPDWRLETGRGSLTLR